MTRNIRKKNDAIVIVANSSLCSSFLRVFDPLKLEEEEFLQVDFTRMLFIGSVAGFNAPQPPFCLIVIVRLIYRIKSRANLCVAFRFQRRFIPESFSNSFIFVNVRVAGQRYRRRHFQTNSFQYQKLLENWNFNFHKIGRNFNYNLVWNIDWFDNFMVFKKLFKLEGSWHGRIISKTILKNSFQCQKLLKN